MWNILYQNNWYVKYFKTQQLVCEVFYIKTTSRLNISYKTHRMWNILYPNN